MPEFLATWFDGPGLSVVEGFNANGSQGLARERLKQGLGIYEIDQGVLAAAQPDLLLTQAICEV